MVRMNLGRIPISITSEGVHKDIRVFIIEIKIILPGYVLDITIYYSRAFNTNGEGEGYLFEPKSRSILSGTINNLQILYFLVI